MWFMKVTLKEYIESRLKSVEKAAELKSDALNKRFVIIAVVLSITGLVVSLVK
jgi:hypothetical protein